MGWILVSFVFAGLQPYRMPVFSLDSVHFAWSTDTSLLGRTIAIHSAIAASASSPTVLSAVVVVVVVCDMCPRRHSKSCCCNLRMSDDRSGEKFLSVGCFLNMSNEDVKKDSTAAKGSANGSLLSLNLCPRPVPPLHFTLSL